MSLLKNLEIKPNYLIHRNENRGLDKMSQYNNTFEMKEQDEIP